MCPYGGTTKEEDKKIESCVASIHGINKRTGKPYALSEKIAICKSQIMGTTKHSEIHHGVEFEEKED